MLFTNADSADKTTSLGERSAAGELVIRSIIEPVRTAGGGSEKRALDLLNLAANQPLAPELEPEAVGAARAHIPSLDLGGVAQGVVAQVRFHCCSVLVCTVFSSFVLFSLLFCTVFTCFVLFCTVFTAVLCCFVLFSLVLYCFHCCFVLFSLVLYCFHCCGFTVFTCFVLLLQRSWLGGADDEDQDEYEDEEEEEVEEKGVANGEVGFRISEAALAAQDAALHGLETTAARVPPVAVGPPEAREKLKEDGEAVAAAVRIQSTHRGRHGRRQVLTVRQQAAAVAEREAAAARIQARQRSRAARRELSEKKEAALKIQATHRGRQGRRDCETVKQQAAAAVADREAMSATKIQSTQRGRQMRRDFLKQKNDLEAAKEQRGQTEAAVRIQAMQRGKQTRKRQAQELAWLQAGAAADSTPDEDEAEVIEVAESDEEEYETVEVYGGDGDDDDEYVGLNAYDEAERETRRWLGLDSEESQELSQSANLEDPAPESESEPQPDPDSKPVTEPNPEPEPGVEPEPAPVAELEPEPVPSFEYTCLVIPHAQFGLGMTLEARDKDAVATGFISPPIGGIGEAESAGVRLGSVVLEVDQRNVRAGGVNAVALAIKMARAGWGAAQEPAAGTVQIELLMRDSVAEEAFEAAELAAWRSPSEVQQLDVAVELTRQELAAVRIQARTRGRKARKEVSGALRQLEAQESASSLREMEALSSDVEAELTLVEQAEALLSMLDAPVADILGHRDKPEPELDATEAKVPAEGAAAMYRQHVREHLVAIYVVHAPQKCEIVDALLLEWAGEEEDLLLQVREKYGVTEVPEPEADPDPCAVFSSPSADSEPEQPPAPPLAPEPELDREPPPQPPSPTLTPHAALPPPPSRDDGSVPRGRPIRGRSPGHNGDGSPPPPTAQQPPPPPSTEGAIAPRGRPIRSPAKSPPEVAAATAEDVEEGGCA